MKHLLIASAFLFLFSAACKEQKIGGVIVDTDLNVLIVDKSDANLLQNGTVKQDQIRLFNIVNGLKQEVFLPSQDFPRNFFVYKFEGPGNMAGSS